MKFVRQKYLWFIAGAFCVCGIALWLYAGKANDERITATVERGDVVQTVTVSGTAKATEAARLRFPDAGRVTDILVKKGDSVEKGDVLAMLEHDDLEAERGEAMAGLSRALAARDELVNGPTNEKRETITVAVENARAELLRVQSEEAAKVAAAKRTYRGSGLALVPEDLASGDSAPIVGGSYACDMEGTYTIDVYRSNALSGHSYRVSGLESGTYSAYTDAGGAFGACGLTLRFNPSEVYRTMSWTLTIPNPRGEQFTANQNALALAQEHERTALETASDALTRAIADAGFDLSDPRNEALRGADADIDTALARVARADAMRERRVLRAPFGGIITDIGPKIGEVASANDPVVTLVSSNAFEVIARVPEIDITKVHEGDQTTLIFDAKDSERIDATLAFLSPLAAHIDGVAYFDATIAIDTVPEWVREGLNADVAITVDERTGVSRLPRRFLTERDGAAYATILENGRDREVPVKIELTGTDGYAAVDLPPDTIVVAPTMAP